MDTAGHRSDRCVGRVHGQAEGHGARRKGARGTTLERTRGRSHKSCSVHILERASNSAKVETDRQAEADKQTETDKDTGNGNER